VPPREVPPRELPHTAQSSTPRSTAGRAVPRAAQYRGPRSTAGREVLHAAKYCTPRSTARREDRTPRALSIDYLMVTRRSARHHGWCGRSFPAALCQDRLWW